MYFKQRFPLILLLLTFALPSTSMASHAWSNYHWERSANPVGISLGDNVDSNWNDYLGMASTDWNASSVLNTTINTGSTKPRQCRAKSGTVQVCNYTYGNNGWLGVASISVSGNHIGAGSVKVNDTYFNTSGYNTPAWRQTVMCQEIGHTFGLDHQDEIFNNVNLDSCMDYTSNPESNQHPNQHDYNQLESIYSHLDGGGGDSSDDGGGGCNPRAPWCNGASAADILSQIKMNGPAQWGRLISEHGPREVYELDFGGGRKVITFVTWTLERAHNHEH
ncbi:MAG: hypothetical protein GQ537_05255 [Gammaproteobacteria bacterium]|nr:hypothetical protein [Gammaproteobacteria bacterium]